ncbi:MAG TPA: bifunctional 5,10-methylenetetrahydrofolate dehydrogenase/5,10-methenyltetrahydrofolate cyclohydrolase [Mollicutes bacterium]|nr:bifunctional 5,10-methylenetetrahydrofolate dehydrogenase/5,10-methenyltetrahydrofolate cyclohydrolase [Mollicutes bacterium]
MTKIIDGKLISFKIKEQIKQEISSLDEKLTLAVVQVGNDEASNVYIRSKEKAATEVGIKFKHLKFDSNVSETELINNIKELNNDLSITGIIVQLPLPKHLNEQSVLETINPKKDVDGLTGTNMGKLITSTTGIIPCTPLGIMTLLEHYNVSLEGKHVVIVGRSNLVSKPLIFLCLKKNATVTVCHSKTLDLKSYTKQADVLIAAVGHKHLINKSMIKKDTVIIDVGINKVDGKLYGDVDFEDVYDKVSLITPVPKGVGPMTVVMLLNNVVKCYENNKNRKGR